VARSGIAHEHQTPFKTLSLQQARTDPVVAMTSRREGVSHLRTGPTGERTAAPERPPTGGPQRGTRGFGSTLKGFLHSSSHPSKK